MPSASQRNIRLAYTGILFTFHLFTFHGLVTLPRWEHSNLTQAEIILSDNSSILVLENNFLFKVKSKQFIHLIAKKFTSPLQLCLHQTESPSSSGSLLLAENIQWPVFRVPDWKRPPHHLPYYGTNQYLLKFPLPE